MKKNKISAEEMRVLIKSIFELSQKLSGNITIKNLDHAAEFAVNLFGYKNWKEFKSNLKKEVNLENLEEMEIELLKEIYLPKKEKLINSNNLYQFKTKKEKVIEKKKSEQYISEYLIGSFLTQNMKTKQPRGLISKDCIITGNYNEYYQYFIEKHIHWLLENNQDFIIFSKKYLNEIKYPDTVIMVNQQKNRLNPIKAILNTDMFESFFRIENAPKSFSYLWSFLVRKFDIEEKSLSIDDLVNMTDLENLISIKKECENDFVLHKMLSQYLSQYVIETENGFQISKENEVRHYRENIYLINKLKEIKNLYQNGYFSEDNEFSLKESIFQKRKCVIADYDNSLYHELIMTEYIVAQKEFQKDKNIVEDQHLIWVLLIEAETWLKNYQTKELNEHTSFAQYYYIQNNTDNIDLLLSRVNQILFLRQSLNYKKTSWKDRMLSLTEEYHTNFWYNDNLVLKSLKDNEALLWRTTDDPFAKNGLENFIMEKIELY